MDCRAILQVLGQLQHSLLQEYLRPEWIRHNVHGLCCTGSRFGLLTCVVVVVSVLPRYNKYGDEFSYSQCPRAQIFRRNVTSVCAIASLQRLLLVFSRQAGDFEEAADFVFSSGSCVGLCGTGTPAGEEHRGDAIPDAVQQLRARPVVARQPHVGNLFSWRLAGQQYTPFVCFAHLLRLLTHCSPRRRHTRHRSLLLLPLAATTPRSPRQPLCLAAQLQLPHHN